MKYFLRFVLIILVAFVSKSFAQDDLFRIPLNVGFYGGLNVNMHTPSFNPYQNIIFNENKIGYGLAAGIIGNFPVSDYITISARLGYNNLSGDLSKSIFTLPDTNVTYNLTNSLNYLEISPMVEIQNLLPIRNIFFIAGLEFDIPVSVKYTLTENRTTLSPLSNVIQNNTEIPDWTMRTALALGAGYYLPLSETMLLTPEITYRIPFTQVSKNKNFSTWDISQLRLGASLTFAFSPLPEEKKEVTEKPSDLQIGFKEIRYYDKDGKYYPLKSIRVEDIQYTELFPVIPYVFCDSNSPAPSKQLQTLRTGSDKGDFTLASLEPDAMTINTRTLDIVGKRMQDNPNAELTITGTIDTKNEKSDKDLSNKRAEFARDYLVKTYKINPEKINIRIGGLPEKPSASSVPEGAEENRRIELSSSNQKLLEPILMKKENQSLAEPNLIEFVPYIISSDSVTAWQVDVSQSDQNLRTFKGAGEAPPLQFVIIPNELKNSQIPIDYNFVASNAKGINKRVSGSIPVDYFSSTRKKSEEQPDKTISKYSLILFDFDKADISTEDMKTIDDYIVPDIKFNSTIKIYGYTDRIGDASYNKKLAERRAEAVKTILAQKVKNNKIEAIGVGENEVMFDNNNPIGRQLSRTVQIYVITPKQ